MMSKCIGIISYLPDDKEIRAQRFKKLCELIETCNYLFNLPIYIVAQNYSREDIDYFEKYTNVTLSDNYMRCGIVGARKKLREWFLTSKYECLIMLDDDCHIIGTQEGAKKYIQELEAHPNSFGEFRGSQLKLFSITKDILSQVDYTDINPENSEGFEDTIFVETLRNKFPKNKFTYSKNTYQLKETSLGAKDVLSTWYTNQNLQEMLRKTRELKELCKS